MNYCYEGFQGIDYPLAAIVLVIIAGVLSILSAIGYWFLSVPDAVIVAETHQSQPAGLVMVMGLWLFAVGVVLVIDALIMKEGSRRSVGQAGIIAIVLSILTLNFFMIVFGVVGGLLALIWKPPYSYEAVRE